MKTTVTIEFDTPEDAADFATYAADFFENGADPAPEAVAATSSNAQPAAAPTTGTKRRGRPSNAAKAAEAATAMQNTGTAAPAAANASAPTAPVNAVQPTKTAAEVRERVQKVIASGVPADALVTVMQASTGVANLKEVPADKLGALWLALDDFDRQRGVPVGGAAPAADPFG